MIVMERFVFWEDVQTIEQFQTLNCSQLSVKNIDKDSHDWLEKAEVMEDHLLKDVTMERLYKEV